MMPVAKLARFLLLKEILSVLILHAVIIKGEWSEWQDWSNCTNCNGVMAQKRYCLTNNCTGVTQQYKTCSTQACKDAPSDIRDQKCSEIKYGGYNWVSLPGSNDCSLDCMYGDYRISNVPADMDGVPCVTNEGKQKGVCLQSICTALGCNGVLGSTAKVNKCLQCLPYEDEGVSVVCEKFEFTLDTELGVPTVLIIPSEATSITFTYGTNKVAMWTSTSSTYHVIVSKISIEGMVFINSNGTLYSDGPLTDNVTLRVEANGQPLSLEYYKTSVLAQANISENYGWVYKDFTECSVTCGSGLEVAHVQCQDSEFPDKVLPDSFCALKKKPHPVVRVCSRPICPPKWEVFEWYMCNAICGGGTQRRVVKCIQFDKLGKEKELPSHRCDENQKPPDTRSCNEHACGQWKLSEWSSCRPSCGQGSRNRSVTCIDSNNQIIDSINCGHPVPSMKKPCFEEPCFYKWKPGPWGKCTNKCGNGHKTRSVDCTTQTGLIVNSSNCQSLKPLTTMPCFETDACSKEWIQTPWGQCQGPCGFSYEYRNVTCKGLVDNSLQILSDDSCSELADKPETRRPCNQTNCPSWHSGPWSECSVTCGEGVRTRNVHCRLPSGEETIGCFSQSKPSTSSSCQGPPCTSCTDWVGLDCQTMVSNHGCVSYIKTDICCHTCSTQ